MPAAKKKSSKKSSKKTGMSAKTGSFRIPRGMKGFVRPVGAYGRFSGSTAEQKFIDKNPPGGVLANGPMVAIMTDILEIPTGTGPSERVGRKIRVTSIEADCSVVTQLTAAVTYNKVTMRLWLDRQNNGVAAAQQDVYDANAAAVCLGTQAPFDLFNENRFQLLGETSRSFSPQMGFDIQSSNAAIPANNQSQMVNAPPDLWHGILSCPLSHVIEYSGPTGAIAEIRSNQIFIEWSSDNGLVSSVFRGNVRVRYTDV